MSSSTDTANATDDGREFVEAREDEAVTNGAELFPNDCGTLNIETRRAFVQLLQGPSIDGRRQTKLWLVLLRDELLLRQHLHNLFLELVIDHDQEVAFTRQIVAESIDAPVLLRRATLTFIESALVLFLRQTLTQADVQGERGVLSRSEIYEHLRVFERNRNVDHARFERQIENALEKAKKLNLLHKIRGSEDRFEVSPTLKLLFPAEEIAALAQSYRSVISSTEHQPSETHEQEGESLPNADDENFDEETE